MAKVFYERSEDRPPTMTVGGLINLLRTFDRQAPVVFKSPRYGAFGPNTMYTLDAAELVSVPREEINHPARHGTTRTPAGKASTRRGPKCCTPGRE